MKAFLSEHTLGITGSAGAWLAVITARQEQAEWTLRCAAYGAAICVSLLTAFYMIRNHGKGEKPTEGLD